MKTNFFWEHCVMSTFPNFYSRTCLCLKTSLLIFSLELSDLA
jgi:hypothetical protein